MTKFNASIVAAVAALLVSGGTMAASLQPAAGELSNNGPVAASTLSRAAVEAQAAAPAAGERSAWAVSTRGSTLTRVEVEAQAIENPPAAGQSDFSAAHVTAAAPAASNWAVATVPSMPAAGESSPVQTVALNGVLTRAEVEAQAALHQPIAGNL